MWAIALHRSAVRRWQQRKHGMESWNWRNTQRASASVSVRKTDGCDGLLMTLVLFVIVDYITGVMCAAADHVLSSAVGFKGICRKVLIFMLVGIANVMDVEILKSGCVLRTAVIFFYLSNEGISLMENATHLGLPIPEKLRDVLEQLHDRSERETEKEQPVDSEGGKDGE